MRNRELIDGEIRHERDFTFDFFGFKVGVDGRNKMFLLRVVRSADKRSRRVREVDGFQSSQQEKPSLEGWHQEVGWFSRKADFLHSDGAWNAPTRAHVPVAEFCTVHRRLALWHKDVIWPAVTGETQLAVTSGYSRRSPIVAPCGKCFTKRVVGYESVP